MGSRAALRPAGSSLAALLWTLPAAAAALALGVLAVIEPEIALSLLLISLAAIAIALRPLYALLVLLAVRAAFADTVFVDAATAVGGLAALAVAAPRLPMKAVTVPLVGLLVIAIPSIPLEPSFDEGAVPDGLYVPVLGWRYAPAPSAELLEWLRLAAVLAIGSLAALAIRSSQWLGVLTGVIVVSSLVPIGIGLEQLASGDTFVRLGTDSESIRGPFTHPNYFAFYLVVVLTVGVVGVMEARSRKLATLGLVPLALGAVCLALTYTRAAWIGFAAVLLLLAVLRDRRILATAAITLLVVSLAFPAATSDVGERFGDLRLGEPATESESDDSWSWRTGQWERMVPYGLDRPLAGEGFGSYSRVTVEEFGTRDPQYSTILDTEDPIGSPRGFSAHNDYVKMLVELGVPGLLLWAAALAGLIVTMARARRVAGLQGYAEGGLALALALAVMAGSDNIQGYTAVLAYALAFCGGVAGVAYATRFRGLTEAGREPGAAPMGTDGGAPTANGPRTGLGKG